MRSRSLTARLSLPGALLLVLGGCSDFQEAILDAYDPVPPTPYVQQPYSASWIESDQIQMVLERTDRNLTEQRILLSNLTAMRGENLVLLRADRAPNAYETRFVPTRLLGETEQTPHPFDPFDSLSFRTREDALGVMNWASWTNHAGLTCVLAFRRLEMTDRSLPDGATVMDIMLRNCIHGEEDTALAPIGPEAVAFGAPAPGPGPRPRMLSPLAAPLP